ncbi:hypothetical protein [Desulfatitalea tepidiphila]|uniref:hypothetical protein n=1 Tax=Desulfatitalea tepidiphila TaxID=1185843 RepID=UPI0006B45FC5|nr:hypothetical protein [Desulfatitalea tepidiphila]
MTIQPEGENIRKAVKWLGAERQANPSVPLHKLIDQACLQFNLSPNEAAYLERLARGDRTDA